MVINVLHKSSWNKKSEKMLIHHICLLRAFVHLKLILQFGRCYTHLNFFCSRNLYLIFSPKNFDFHLFYIKSHWSMIWWCHSSNTNVCTLRLQQIWRFFCFLFLFFITFLDGAISNCYCHIPIIPIVTYLSYLLDWFNSKIRV